MQKEVHTCVDSPGVGVSREALNARPRCCLQGAESPLDGFHHSNGSSHANGAGGSESLGSGGALSSRTPDGEPVSRAVPLCNAGGDIDDMLNHRESAGESVLSPMNALETEWNVPDLNLIFRPPKILMEAMAIGISPGKWVKLAPNATAGVQRSKWKTLKTVMSSGAYVRGAACTAPPLLRNS